MIPHYSTVTHATLAARVAALRRLVRLAPPGDREHLRDRLDAARADLAAWRAVQP